MSVGLATTWWGHSAATVELGEVRVGTDPLFAMRLAHLRRHGPRPGPDAYRVDLVLVSHLHADHLHVPSLAAVDATAPMVVPRGARAYLRGLGAREIVEVEPGESLGIAGLRVDVLAARHEGRRHRLARHGAPAIGFRVDDGRASFWYPGDTGLDESMSDVQPVDLALVPVGGWGPTVGPEHLDPDRAVTAVGRVGARWAVPVHFGTFWPVGLQVVGRGTHRRLFAEPGSRFSEAMESADTEAIVLGHGERVVLVPGDEA